MALTPPSAAASPDASGQTQRTGYLPALLVLTTLFFMWGLITSLNDILIPHLKAAFSLSYVEAMLIQFCFFGAYFVMSVPSGLIVQRLGYKHGIIIGLSTAGAGCLLFYPAAGMQSYPWFLGALFVLASGITLLQVAANPYVAILGPSQTASSRLTLTQAFNSLGTTIGPLLGSALILSATAINLDSAQVKVAEAAKVQGPYVMLAVALVTIAVIIAVTRLPKIEAAHVAPSATDAPQRDTVWSHPNLVFGAVAIFVYVGAEVAIGSLLVSFMALPSVAALSPEAAGNYLAFYWGGAMVGRFIGAAVMTRIQPGRVLAFNAVAIVALLAIVMLAPGKTSMWALLAVGLFNSIMFPTIFTLALAGLGKHTGSGSGILCMAIVGGALVPVLQAFVADTVSLLYSFAIPLVCYLYIAFYGMKRHRQH